MSEIAMLDTVALLEDIPEHGLNRGEKGAVVGIYAPDVYGVEFVDLQGRTYALLALRDEQLLKLRRREAA